MKLNFLILLGNTTRKKYIWEKWNMTKNSAAWKGSAWKGTSQNMKEWNLDKVTQKRVQQEKSATEKQWIVKTVQYENHALLKIFQPEKSGTSNKCNKDEFKFKKLHQDKSATGKNCIMERMKHGKSAIWIECKLHSNVKIVQHRKVQHKSSGSEKKAT